MDEVKYVKDIINDNDDILTVIDKVREVFSNAKKTDVILNLKNVFEAMVKKYRNLINNVDNLSSSKYKEVENNFRNSIESVLTAVLDNSLVDDNVVTKRSK